MGFVSTTAKPPAARDRAECRRGQHKHREAHGGLPEERAIGVGGIYPEFLMGRAQKWRSG
jgi:hypothetical protein